VDVEQVVRTTLRFISSAQQRAQKRRLDHRIAQLERKHGFVRISISGVIAVLLVFGGFIVLQKAERVGSCEFVEPMGGRAPLDELTWGFGVNTGFQVHHTGVDIPGIKFNEPVTSTAAGKVVWADWWPGSQAYYKVPGKGTGNTVIVETWCSGVPYYHLYGHLNTIDVKPNQDVEIGTKLGGMGLTGATTGLHLHFEIRKHGPTEYNLWENGDYLNPVIFIPQHSSGNTVVAFGLGDIVSQFKQTGLSVSGWMLIILGIVVLILFGEFQGIWGLIVGNIVPGIILGTLIVTMELAPMLQSMDLSRVHLSKIAWASLPSFVQRLTSSQTCEVSPKFPQGVLQWCEIITKYASENKLDPDLVAAQMLQESGGNSSVISSSGAVGLLQVMPRDGLAATLYPKLFADRPSIIELKDAVTNVSFATRYLASLVAIYDGNIREALLHYGPIDVGYYYADTVLSIYERYKK